MPAVRRSTSGASSSAARPSASFLPQDDDDVGLMPSLDRKHEQDLIMAWFHPRPSHRSQVGYASAESALSLTMECALAIEIKA